MKRLQFVAIAFSFLIASATEIRAAASAEFQLYPLTGDVRLSNPNVTQFDFVYYELTSAANAFTGAPAAWTSIADNYDAGGNGYVDPINQWIKFSGTSSMVAEGLFVGTGSHLPAFGSIDLGKIWGPEVVKPNDVAATILDPSGQAADVSVSIALVGDYNRDLVVDALDYTVWRTALGSQSDPNADGNFDGIVDAADYTVWRDNFGLSLAGAGYDSLASGGSSIGDVSVVPEPSSVLLAALAGASYLLPRSSRRKRQRQTN